MSRRLNVAVGVATGCAVGAWVLAGAGSWSSGRLVAFASTLRQAATRLGGARGPHDVTAGLPATSGGVIPLETVPIDELSEWELDLLTTPDR